jgi:hypothetical protein
VSSDQWDPTETVRVRFTYADGKRERVWTRPVTRRAAEEQLASAVFLAMPWHRGRPVASACIRTYHPN